MPLPNEVTTSTIVGPDGSLVTKPAIIFTAEEARLLRLYKKFLSRHGLREALYCDGCWDFNLEYDGCRGGVTDNKILIECRCKTRYFQGMTL